MPARTKKQPASPKKPAAPFASTGFWLMKSEPSSYSIEQFERDGKTLWTGVRNYQARNFMMTSMKTGDLFLFYHSNAEPAAIVGVGEIVRPNQPDPTDEDLAKGKQTWFCAEVRFKERLARAISLAEIRGTKELAEMALLRPGQRLSIQPVSKAEFDRVLKMARSK
jgi:predicted RNA-binding protein with PUA-like domain